MLCVLQENSHFVVVDMMLEALEAAKWAVLGQRGSGASQKCADCIWETSQTKTKNCTPRPIQHSGSIASSDSGYVGKAVYTASTKLHAHRDISINEERSRLLQISDRNTPSSNSKSCVISTCILQVYNE